MRIKFLKPGLEMETRRRIFRRFGWENGMTVNGEKDVTVHEKDVPLLEETARRGFLAILKRR